jgi:pilus assembly protein CpaB
MLQGKYPLLIALVLGLLAGLIAYSAIKAREAQVRKGWETRRILCAKTDIVEGTDLDEEMIEICEIPEKFVTDSFIQVPEGDEEGSSVMPYGQKVLVPLKRGDPVLFSHFESQRNFTLSESIPAKARAIAIDVREQASVNQWVRPNDHVDVIGTFRDPNTRELVAVTLMQNIIVLATGHYSGMSVLQTDEDKKYSQVVLLTLPEEAEILALAAESGQLTLTLRNPKDLDVGDTDQKKQKTDTNTLLSGERSDALRKIRQTSFQSVEIIKGSTGTKEIKGGGMPEAGHE